MYKLRYTCLLLKFFKFVFWGEIYVSDIDFLKALLKRGRLPPITWSQRQHFSLWLIFFLQMKHTYYFLALNTVKLYTVETENPVDPPRVSRCELFRCPFLQIWILRQTKMDPILNTVYNLAIFVSNVYWHLTMHICMWVGVCHIVSKDRTQIQWLKEIIIFLLC